MSVTFCEVHLELLSKYQENQTVTTLKEVDGWSFLWGTIFSFSGGNCRVSWWSTCTNFDEKKGFLGLNKNSKTYSLSNRLSTFQTLDLAGHARILITVGPATSWGMRPWTTAAKTGENQYRLNSAQLQKGKIHSFKCTVEAEATKNILSRARVLAQWDVDQKRRRWTCS